MMAKGLGSGLGALFGEEAVESQNGVELVSISKVEPKQGQPRVRFDPEQLDALADSIREHGLIQPITVRPLDNGFYQIIAGERRWRASRQAGLLEVPIRILDVDDREAMELALVENLQREDLNPVEEAKGYKTLIAEYGLTQEECAKRVGKSRPVITNSMRLLVLPKRVLEMLENGELSMSHARALLELEKPEQQEEAAVSMAEKQMSVRQATALVKKMLRPAEPEPQKEETVVNYVAEAEMKMTRAIGHKVKIVEGRKKGRLEIEYFGEDDLETLYELFLSLAETEEE